MAEQESGQATENLLSNNSRSHTIDNETPGVTDEAVEIVRETKDELSILRLALIACGALGVELAWGLEWAMVVPFFQQELGFTAWESQSLWVFGPISGFFVAPLVGHLSDRCTLRVGRRRPFLAAGAILVTLFSTTLAFSRKLGLSLGDTEAYHPSATAIAVVAFACNDLAINVVQFPQKSLAAETVPISQFTLAQAMNTAFTALGTLTANTLLLLVEEPVSNYGRIVLAANFVIVCCVAITCCAAKENPPSQYEPQDTMNEGCGIVKEVVQHATHMAPTMKRVVCVQALSWFAFFIPLSITTAWAGHIVYLGNPHSGQGSQDNMRFQQGVQFAGGATMARAVVQLITSLCLSPLSKRYGTCRVWRWSLIILSVCLMAMCVSTSKTRTLAFFAVALLGVPLAAQNTFPFAIVSVLCRNTPGSLGVNFGILNWAITVPQLVDTLYAGALTEKTGSESTVLGVACFWAMGSVIAALSLKRDRDKLLEIDGNQPPKAVD